jgi:Uma2 family endonuclease
MVQTSAKTEPLYPDSDGKPMADNTEQYQWIVRLVSNLRALLKDQVAFVAGDLLWYPLRVDEPPTPSQAPDVMVVLGRPMGYRGSYKQWKEENIAPQVVFEILSPSNSASELAQKQNFYVQHGVLEMYVYDPTSYEFWGLVRSQKDETPRLVTPLNLPWASPVLGIEFKMFDDGLTVFYPNGDAFQDPEEVLQERAQTQEKLNRAWAKLRELGIEPEDLE